MSIGLELDINLILYACMDELGGAGLLSTLHLQEKRKASLITTGKIMHGIQGTWSSPWLDVHQVSMKSPHSLVTSPSSVDIAADGILGHRHHAEAGVEAWQTAKWAPTLAVLVVVAGAAIAVPQSPRA